MDFLLRFLMRGLIYAVMLKLIVMVKINVFIGTFILFGTSASILNHDLIVGFCRTKNLSRGVIISCLNKKERLQMLKELWSNYLEFVIPDSACYDQREMLFNHNCHIGIILDGSCIPALDLLKKSSEGYFYEKFHWLILAESKDSVVPDLNGTSLNINADVYLAISNNNETWTIYDAYNPAAKHRGLLTITQIGHFNHNLSLSANTKSNKYWTRKNMTGVHFKSAVVVPDHRINLQEYLSSENNRRMDSMHRFQSVTVRYCRDFYNFELEIGRTNSWGYKQSDGQFDGLVGLLERRLIDFGSSPLIYKLDRMPVIDYSYGNWILRSTFIYRRPKIEAASYEIFLRPLSTTVWLCVLLFMCFILAELKVIFTREKHVLNSDNDRMDNSWSFLFLFTLGAFCQQGATCHPQFLSSRIVSLFVFLFCILIYQFYSASIVSYLLMDPPRVIYNLKDLMDSNLRVGIEDILIDRNYFVQTTDPVAIELFERKVQDSNNNSGFYEPLTGLQQVQEGGFAYHVETSTAYPIIENVFTNQEICELEEVQMYKTQPMHTNLQKNSPFREMMNYCMFRLAEDGNLHRLRTFWDARKPSCIESAKTITIHVGIREFSCGLLVLCYGVCFSLIFMVLEIGWYHKWFHIKRIGKIIKPFTH